MTATLSWGVKQSFRGYVEGAGGTIEAKAGATRTEDGGFAFEAEPQAEGRFRGEVNFQAHGGMLSVFIADPWLETGPDGGLILTVADHPKRDRRLQIARLDPAAGPGEFAVLLSPEGSYLLGGHYPANTPLDPLRLIPG